MLFIFIKTAHSRLIIAEYTENHQPTSEKSINISEDMNIHDSGLTLITF